MTKATDRYFTHLIATACRLHPPACSCEACAFLNDIFGRQPWVTADAAYMAERQAAS